MVPSIMLLLLAAPRGLEPRNPESEAGVLPIRLRGMAGDKGVEPLQTRSQSPARYHYANPQYKQDT